MTDVARESGDPGDRPAVRPALNFTAVPHRYQRCRLDNYVPRTERQRTALAALWMAIRDRPISEQLWPCADGEGAVILTGPCGTGKTHLAVGLWYEDAYQALESGGDDFDAGIYRFVAGADLQRRWRDPKARDRDIEHHLNGGCWSLMLDDLLPPATAAEAEGLAWLIDQKYRSYGGLGGLIITTNMTPAELRQALGDRTADRLRENALILPLDGSSHRKTANARGGAPGLGVG